MKQNYHEKYAEYKKAKIELWKDLNINDIKQVIGCFEQQKNSYELAKQIICDKYKLNLSKKCDQIVYDKYYYLIKFCLNNKFNEEQISALLYTIKSTHQLAISTAYGNFDETFDYLKKMLLLYSVHRPPTMVKLFEPEQIKLCLDYFLNTYFRQFKLYKLIFTPAIKFDIKLRYSNDAVVVNDVVDDEHQNEQQPQQQQQSEQELQHHELYETNADYGDEQQEYRELTTPNENEIELKSLIKKYLLKQIDSMKATLSSSITDNENELNRKITQANPTPATQTKGKKK